MLRKCIDELRTQLTAFGYKVFNDEVSLGTIRYDNYGKGAVLFILGEEISDPDETTMDYLTNNISIRFLISVQCEESTWIDAISDALSEFKLFINDNQYLDCNAMLLSYVSGSPYVDKGGVGSYGGIAVETNLLYRQLRKDPTNK